MTKVSFEMPSDLHEEFKSYAAEHKMSLKSLLINSARNIVSESRPPNKETMQSIRDTKNRRNLTYCSSVKELFERFGIAHD
jgi:hypothetical protein